MTWIFERFGLRGSLMGSWDAICQRKEHAFSFLGGKGTLPVEGLRSVPSFGLDTAVFAKYGPLIADMGVSPSWSNTHNTIQYRGLLGIVIPLGRGCELRILGGYRKFLTSTTNLSPIVRESAGPAIQIDVAALLGEKGAFVMTTRGSLVGVQEDIQPVVALGVELLVAGRHGDVRDHTEAELALDRANETLKAARDLVSRERIQSELDWYRTHEVGVSSGFDVVERVVNFIVLSNHDSLTDLKERAYAAAKYAAGYAVVGGTREASRLLLKEIDGLSSELKLTLATHIANDTFHIVRDITLEGHRLKTWMINSSGRSNGFIRKRLDHYAKILDRFQSLIGNLTVGNFEVLNVLAKTSQTVRCLQGKSDDCEAELLAISHDRLVREFKTGNELEEW